MPLPCVFLGFIDLFGSWLGFNEPKMACFCFLQLRKRVSELEALNGAFQDEIEDKNAVIKELCAKLDYKTTGSVSLNLVLAL